MPRVMGVNMLGVLLAALAMWMIGFVWYGVAFSDAWMASRGYVDADFEGSHPAWMAGGFVLELVAALGIGWLMKRLGVSTLGAAVGFGLTLALLIALPMISYEVVYSAEHSLNGWLIDASHVIATFVAGAAVLSFFD